MATPYNMISGDAQRALTEFSEDFDRAFALSAEVVPWSKQFGLVNSSRAVKTTYPIPLSAAGYKRRKGDDKLRSLYERSLSMSPVEWSDGFAAQAMIVEAPDFIGWAGEPGRIADEATRHPNTLVAEMLAANPNLGFYKDPDTGTDAGIPLFSALHPVNIFRPTLGTFDNDHGATGINATMMKAARHRFRTRKGPNGKPMGRRLTHMLVPAALEEEAKEFLESDLMYNATLVGSTNTQITSNNIYKGAVQLVVAEELADDDKFYLLDGSKGCFPWIVQDGGSPEQITYDKTDAMYKDTGKIGMKFVLLMAVAAALPHCIERITIS